MAACKLQFRKILKKPLSVLHTIPADRTSGTQRQHWPNIRNCPLSELSPPGVQRPVRSAPQFLNRNDMIEATVFFKPCPQLGLPPRNRQLDDSIAGRYSPRWAAPFNRARFSKACCAAATFSALPCHAWSTVCCRARP